MVSAEQEVCPEGGIGSELGESMITGRAGSGFSSVPGKFESDHDEIDSGGMTTDVCSWGVSGCCGTAPRELDGTLASEGINEGFYCRDILFDQAE